MSNKACINCFNPLGEGPVCPNCGFDHAAYRQKEETMRHALRPGVLLHDRYLVGRVLGHGCFGITYTGFDIRSYTKIVVKEYFPHGLGLRIAEQTESVTPVPPAPVREDYDAGMRKCLEEARAAAALDPIPGVARIRDVFQANNTAYVIMEFAEGVTLGDYWKRLPQKPALPEAAALLAPVGEALEQIHARGFVHRDVKPENIIIDREGRPTLLDFGVVKMLMPDHADDGPSIFRLGFYPTEMYQKNGKTGPWTDVYSYCATLYWMITGKVVKEPPDRLTGEDTFGESLPPELRRGLAVWPEERCQSMAELTAVLSKAPAPPCCLRPGTVLQDRYRIDRFLGQGQTFITYDARDTMLEKRVVVKEYFPMGMVWREAAETDGVSCFHAESNQEDYDESLRYFMRKAHSLAKLYDIPGLAQMRDVFQANNTAYLIMDFVEGVTLKDYRKRLLREPTLPEAAALLAPVAGTLEQIHARGFVHLNVSPDNIILTKGDRPVLMEIRLTPTSADGGGRARPVILRRGFSPIEMYVSNGKIGPWADVYSYCATLYWMITGKAAKEPPDRLMGEDTFGESLPPELRRGLALRPEERCQSMAELTAGLTITSAKERCGDNVYYALSPGGELILSGTGDTWDFEMGTDCLNPSPFDGNPAITSVVVEEGVTRLGRYLFRRCENLKRVTLPRSLRSIGAWAFGECGALEELPIPEGSKITLEAYAFFGCGNLKQLHVQGKIVAERNAFKGSALQKRILMTKKNRNAFRLE